MPDRVKQAVFDMLGVHFDCPGALPGIRVADVFAGSGSLGLEALSRGAGECWFFEREREALAILEKNIALVAAEGSVRVLPGDAWRTAASSHRQKPFELIFLDPPYRDALDTTAQGRVPVFLGKLAEDSGVSCLVVLHHPAAVEFSPQAGDRWRVVERRTFGSNGVTFIGL